MRLKKIIENLEILKIKNFKNYNITTVTHISSDVTRDSLFFCINGNNYNGNDFAKEAVDKGVKCLITEDASLNIDNVTIVVVRDTRIAMSVVGYNFYNRSVDSLKLVGVIGTSGKTTTSIIIGQILANSGKNVGVIGTNGIFIGNMRLDNKFTTPDPLELHYIFYQMKMLGVKIVVMEVSAQAIFYKKVYGIYFDICVFTNISSEHLDFFGSIEKYAKVKMDFFRDKNMRECVVNIDDFFGRELAYKVDIPCISMGIDEPANSFAVDILLGLNTSRFCANILDDIVLVTAPFVGKYNVYNIIAGLTVCKMLGLSADELQKGVDQLKPIPGRFNHYIIDGKEVIVDFAHTPDSIEKLLGHISAYCKKNIICVFGCVGYSNQEKRIEMARAVARFSSRVIITTDNRGETVFSSIADDIILGLGEKRYVCIEDRCEAIRYAFKSMRGDDILVIMGKGAENFQTIGKERIKYSDLECVESLTGEMI